jgi:hypothetical protein
MDLGKWKRLRRSGVGGKDCLVAKNNRSIAGRSATTVVADLHICVDGGGG